MNVNYNEVIRVLMRLWKQTDTWDSETRFALEEAIKAVKMAQSIKETFYETGNNNH